MKLFANLFLRWYKGGGAGHPGTHECIEWNREFHFLSYGGLMLVLKRCVRPHIHLSSICDENESRWHFERRRGQIQGLTKTTFRMPNGPRRCWPCIPIYANWLSSKTFSTVPTPIRASTNDKPYASSLRLPKTRFPLWSEPDKRELPFRDRTTTELYRWQVRGSRQPRVRL